MGVPDRPCVYTQKPPHTATPRGLRGAELCEAAQPEAMDGADTSGVIS